MSVTRDQITNGLRALGLGRGMGLMVHSSLRSFGHVEGGAQALIGALMDLVGPEGTILMPSFNHGAPFDEGGPGVYDPLETPSVDGRVTDVFWRMPGVLRSLDPTHAFAAWGRSAERYTRGHHLTLTMGEDSPLGLLMRDGGRQVHLGTTHATTTAKHLAETMLRVPCLGLRTEAYPVRLPGGQVVEHRTWGWRERSCPLTESGEFIEAEMERLGLQRKGSIGACRPTVSRLDDLVRAVSGLLERGYGDLPPCSGCAIRPRVVAATRPSDWDEERKRPRAASEPWV